MAVCRFIRHLVGHQHHVGSGRMSQQKSPPLPFMFQTPKGQLIDLRLFSKELMDKVRPVVSAVLQVQSKATRWSHGVHPSSANKAEIKKATEAVDQEEDGDGEAIERLWETLATHPDLERLGSGIGHLLVDQARASLAMKRSAKKVRERFTADLIQAEVDIRLRHPLLSLIQPWMDKQLRQIKVRKFSDIIPRPGYLIRIVYFAGTAGGGLPMEVSRRSDRNVPGEIAGPVCLLPLARLGLSQRRTTFRQSVERFSDYFLSLSNGQRAPMLSKELAADKQPTRTFTWDTWIWRPSSWIVRRHFRGVVEVVPTHLSKTPTSITNPRTPDDQRGGGGQEQPVFTLERSSRRTTSSQWPLWRWTNFLQRTWSWSWNGAYACGYLVPWCSPVGLRALLSAQPFYADLELSQVNGALCPRRSSYTPTLTSRLASLWRHISKSRTEFETQPDTGLVGKGLTRQANRAWNYGVKGLFGSLLLLLIFPAVCVLCSFGGLCLAVSAPLWAPLLALIYHVLIVLVWDVDNPDATKRGPLLPLLRVLGRDLLFEGLLQPMACLATALVFCPILSVLLALCKLFSNNPVWPFVLTLAFFYS